MQPQQKYFFGSHLERRLRFKVESAPAMREVDREEYSRLISEAYVECRSRFAALASPTFSKQESVSFLYQTLKNIIYDGKRLIRFPWKSLMLFIPRMLWMFVRVLYAAIRFRVNSIPENAVLFRSWLVPRSFSNGKVVDEYFRKLIDDVARTENVTVSYTTVTPKLLKQFGAVHSDGGQFFSYGLLSVWDVFRLFFDYFFTALVQVKKRYYLSGVDVTSCINRALLMDYLGLRSFEAYAEKYKCNSLLQYNPKAFVYIFENQSWEKVCCDALSKHGVKIIGYQSSGFSPLFLNFFPNEIDLKQNPMPDCLLTVGPLFNSYLLEHGVYTIPVESFAALRFSYPTDKGKYVVLESNLDIFKRVLYAFPVHLGQYVVIIMDLIEVFGESEIDVDLKFHPLFGLNEIKGLPPLPDNFNIVSDVDVDGLRDVYDCVLFNDNSFGIEAMIKGVRSYQYGLDGCFLDDRFIYFDLWETNYVLDDLYVLKEKICSCQYRKLYDHEAVAEYINNMYSPYGDKSLKRFLDIVNER